MVLIYSSICSFFNCLCSLKLTSMVIFWSMGLKSNPVNSISIFSAWHLGVQLPETTLNYILTLQISGPNMVECGIVLVIFRRDVSLTSSQSQEPECMYSYNISSWSQFSLLQFACRGYYPTRFLLALYKKSEVLQSLLLPWTSYFPKHGRFSCRMLFWKGQRHQ